MVCQEEWKIGPIAADFQAKLIVVLKGLSDQIHKSLYSVHILLGLY